MTTTNRAITNMWPIPASCSRKGLRVCFMTSFLFIELLISLKHTLSSIITVSFPDCQQFHNTRYPPLFTDMIYFMSKSSSELHLDYKGRKYRLSIEQRRGSDDLIVFLHGWGGAKESFTEAFSSAALNDFDICTIDLPGFGKSDKPSDFSYDLLDQAKIVALAINSLNAERVYLVGHSMGGGAGLLAAPLLKKKLAIFISAEGNLAPNGSGTNARAVSGQPFWLFKSFTLPLLIILLRVSPKRSVRVRARWFDQASPLGLYRSVQSLAHWSDSGELLPLFKSLPHKAYIYSEHGKRRKDVVLKLNKSITYEIPASGHVLMDNNPHDFYTTVATIIRSI
jgi:pimeloyl-ACP methyl ester carboxylesterase